MNIQIHITTGSRHIDDSGEVSWSNEAYSQVLVSFLMNTDSAINEALEQVRKQLEKQLKTG